jgi:hypothetical protein
MSDSDKPMLRNYIGFSNVLRTWLTSYGIGFFVFVASQETIINKLKSSLDETNCLLIIMVVALGIQVFAAFIYKFSMAYLSVAEEQGSDGDFKNTRRYKVSEKVYKSFVFEALLDLASISLYVWGTLKLVVILLS